MARYNWYDLISLTDEARLREVEQDMIDKYGQQFIDEMKADIANAFRYIVAKDHAH